MSLFGKIFRAKSNKPEPTTQEALQELGETEELLIKKQEYLNKQIETSVATAKKHVTTNKRLALKALKEKKVHEKKLEEIEGILDTIHHQKNSVENAALHANVLGVMTRTSAALKTTHKGMDVDKVHDLIEEIAEQQEVSNEITQAISNPIGLQNDIDDDELMKELAQMEETEINEKLMDIGPIPVDNVTNKLPEVPKEKLPKPNRKNKKMMIWLSWKPGLMLDFSAYWIWKKKPNWEHSSDFNSTSCILSMNKDLLSIYVLI